MPDAKYTGLQDDGLPHGRYIVCNAQQLVHYTEAGSRLVRVLDTEHAWVTNDHRLRCAACANGHSDSADDYAVYRSSDNQYRCHTCRREFVVDPKPALIMKGQQFLVLVDIDHVYEELSVRAQTAEEALGLANQQSNQNWREIQDQKKKIAELTAANEELQTKLENTKVALAAAHRDLGLKRVGS